jgi:hypothetical protein
MFSAAALIASRTNVNHRPSYTSRANRTPNSSRRASVSRSRQSSSRPAERLNDDRAAGRLVESPRSSSRRTRFSTMSTRPTPCGPAIALSFATRSCPASRSPLTAKPDDRARTRPSRPRACPGRERGPRSASTRRPGGDVPRILDRAALVADVPEVAVARVELLKRAGRQGTPRSR